MQIKEELENLNLKVLHLQREILLLKKALRERAEESDIKIGKLEADLEDINKFFAQIDLDAHYED